MHRVVTILIALASLATVSLWWRDNLLLLVFLILLSMVMLFRERSKAELFTFLFCGIAGACAEMVAIYAGAWTYGNPNMINIPIWLPVLWGIAGVFMGKVYTLFKRHYK